MTVKSIFKALVGTSLLIAISSSVIELMNIQITSIQLKQMAKTAAYDACSLFTQETYKTESDGGGAVRIQDVRAADGSIYLTGDFYTGSSAEEIYRELYDSRDFQDFCSGANVWSSGDMTSLFEELNKLGGYDPTTYGEMYTPVNIGVPYMDRETTNKMFQWSLARILSNCNPALIQTDENGRHYVNYKGFAVYCDEAQLVNYNYYVYDLTSPFTVEEKQMLLEMTGISDAGAGLTLQEGEGVAGVENNYVTAVAISYRVPARYIGITPMKRIFEYTWNNEVAGYSETGETMDLNKYDHNRRANDNLVLAGGGTSGMGLEDEADQTLAPLNTLYYSLTR